MALGVDGENYDYFANDIRDIPLLQKYSIFIIKYVLCDA